MKKNHFRSFAILFGLLVCGAACYGLLHLWQLPVEDSWIPAPYAPPLAKVSDRVQLYVAGEPLLKLVEAQQVVVKKNGAEAPVVADTLVASVNNFEQIRMARLPMMLALAAAAGGALVLFLVGLCAPLIKALKPPPIVDLHLEA